MSHVDLSPLFPGSVVWPIDQRERFWTCVCQAAPVELAGRAEDPSRPARSARLAAALGSVAATGAAMAQHLTTITDQGLDADAAGRRAVRDEQHGHQRRMWELLIDLIEWTACDHEWAYRHRAALDRLRAAKALELDFRDFYGARTHLVSAEVDAAAAACAVVEGAADFDARALGYLPRERPLDTADLRGLHPGRMTRSLRGRMLAALRHADYNDRLVLGLSYERLFSRLSQSVHFGTGAAPHPVTRSDSVDPTPADLRRGLIHLGSLAGQSIRRVIVMIGGPAGDATEILAGTAAGAGPNAEMLFDLTDGGLAVGDFVIVFGRYLAEVVGRRIAPIGHVTYDVAYLAERPDDAETADQWPAEFVSPFVARQALIDELERQTAAAGLDAERVLTAGHASVTETAREYMRRSWRKGLREKALDAALSPPGG